MIFMLRICVTSLLNKILPQKGNKLNHNFTKSEVKTMSTPVNAETAAKINAMEHVAELYKQADDQK